MPGSEYYDCKHGNYIFGCDECEREEFRERIKRKLRPVKVLHIDNCKMCPHMEQVYVGQGNHKWVCLKEKRKAIAYVEAPGSEPKAIPEWCPLDDMQ